MRKLLGILVASIIILAMGTAYISLMLHTGKIGGVEIHIVTDETNFNVTITIFNRGDKTIEAPNWAYTYILKYSNGTEYELYRTPCNWTAPPLSPEKKWSHVDNLYSFLNVKNGKRILKLPVGKFQLFARYKSKNNPYNLSLPYEVTDSNILSLKTEAPLKVPKARILPHIDGKIEQEEWNDAKVYKYSWKNGGPYSPIVEGTLNITLALKHDDSHLYILFLINDDKDIHHLLKLIIQHHSIYINMDGKTECFPKDGVNISVAISYINGTYVFEIEMNIQILYGDIVPFNLIFIEDPSESWRIAPIGGWNNGEPGIIFCRETLTEVYG